MLRLFGCCAAAAAVLVLSRGPRRGPRSPPRVPLPESQADADADAADGDADADTQASAPETGGHAAAAADDDDAAAAAAAAAVVAAAAAAGKGVAARLDAVAPVVRGRRPPGVECGDECAFCLEQLLPPMPQQQSQQPSPTLVTRTTLKKRRSGERGGSSAPAPASRLRVTPCGHALHAHCLERWVFHRAAAYLDCENYSLADDGRVDGVAPPPSCPICAALLPVVSHEDRRRTLLATVARSLALTDLAAADDLFRMGLVRWRDDDHDDEMAPASTEQYTGGPTVAGFEQTPVAPGPVRTPPRRTQEQPLQEQLQSQRRPLDEQAQATHDHAMPLSLAHSRSSLGERLQSPAPPSLANVVTTTSIASHRSTTSSGSSSYASSSSPTLSILPIPVSPVPAGTAALRSLTVRTRIELAFAGPSRGKVSM